MGTTGDPFGSSLIGSRLITARSDDVESVELLRSVPSSVSWRAGGVRSGGGDPDAGRQVKLIRSSSSVATMNRKLPRIVP